MGRRRKEERHELDDAIDQLIVSVRTQDDFLGLIQELKQRMVNRILEAKMQDHQEGRKNDDGHRGIRNGYTCRTVQTENGPIQVKSPRNRRRKLRTRADSEASSQADGAGADDLSALRERSLDARSRQCNERSLPGGDQPDSKHRDHK